jgi:Tol biopolymer transport system component
VTYGSSDVYALPLSEDLRPAGEPRELTSNHEWTTSPGWTPDGRQIIVATGSQTGFDGVRGLWEIAARGPAARKQLLFASEQASSPAVSRQGNRLVFNRLVHDTNIWRLDLPKPGQPPGAAQPLIASTRADHSPQFSPDGKKIVFISARSGHSEVWAANSDGSNLVQLSSLEAPITGAPRWSPDGKLVVFDSNHAGQWQLYVVSADGGKLRQLTKDRGGAAVGSWSRDGRWIYFTSGRTGRWEIWRMPSQGDEAVQVTKSGGHVAFESPDGKFLYYSKTLGFSSLWKIPVTGGPDEQVLGSVSGSEFAVTAHGIYFIAPPQPDGALPIQFLPFETGKVKTIATIPKPLWNGMAVSPDEKTLLYTQTDQSRSELLLVENIR